MSKMICKYDKTSCMAYSNGECHTIENCGGQIETMTNYEKIKNMSVEEMAKFIDNLTFCCSEIRNCEKCPLRLVECCNDTYIEKWLNNEVLN